MPRKQHASAVVGLAPGPRPRNDDLLESEQGRGSGSVPSVLLTRARLVGPADMGERAVVRGLSRPRSAQDVSGKMARLARRPSPAIAPQLRCGRALPRPVAGCFEPARRAGRFFRVDAVQRSSSFSRRSGSNFVRGCCTDAGVEGVGGCRGSSRQCGRPPATLGPPAQRPPAPPLEDWRTVGHDPVVLRSAMPLSPSGAAKRGSGC